MLAQPTGGISPRSIVMVADLNEDILGQLFRDEICVLRVPNYASPEALSSLRKFMYNAQRHFTQSYYMGYKKKKPVRKFYGVHLWGTPYNSTYNHGPDHESVTEYYGAALAKINTLRKALSPHLSPIDRLRLQLDEHWPAGARIGTFSKDKNMFVGVGRFVYAKNSFLGEAQPHFDSLPQHIQDLEKQYSANIYMDVPHSGGELEIWDVPPLTAQDIVQADVGKNWRSILPPPLVIKPNLGELILFNTRRPHAVRGFENGLRSSLQCFIGVYKDNTLEFWS